MGSVIFVDGPTAVGKGHFINQLKERLEKEGKPVISFNLSEFVTAKTPTEARKYTQYATTDDDITIIHKAHLEAIDHLLALLEKHEDQRVIVDRSYVTFVVYNLANIKNKYTRMGYIEEYRRKLQELSKEHQVTYIQLEHDLENDFTVDKLLDLTRTRILSRDDGKEIDEQWILKLNAAYHFVGKRVAGIYNETHFLTSSDIDLVPARL